MRKYMFMAVSVSVLMTGCLVKKSDYEAEQAAHEATKQELSNLKAELEGTASKLDGTAVNLAKSEALLARLKTQLSESRAALTAAQKEVDGLKSANATSAQRSSELAVALKAAETKLMSAKARYQKQLAAAKSAQDEANLAKSELEAFQKKNEQLRRFMVINYSEAGFHAFQEVEATDGQVSDVIVQKAAAASTTPVAKPATSNDNAKTSNKSGNWWNLWNASEEAVATNDAPAAAPSFDITSFKTATVANDYRGAAKEAMRLAAANQTPSRITALAGQLMEESMSSENVDVVKWVSVGIVSGAGAERDAAREAVLAAATGTKYQVLVNGLLAQ